MNLREFIKQLRKKDMIKTVHKEVDVQYEIATILKQLDGTPLYFEKVKGFSMPVVGNICSTRELVSLGLQIKKEDIIRHRLVKRIISAYEKFQQSKENRE